MPGFHVKDGDTWRHVKDIYLNDAGLWRHIKAMWVKKSGVWRLIFRAALKIDISNDAEDLDLFAAAGAPVDQIDVVLTIGLGVSVGSTDTSHAAIYGSQDFPNGSTVRIINKGTIIGKGGVGGNGSGRLSSGYDGHDAGDAIQLSCNTIIDNTYGKIFAGGGGGGGGGSTDVGYGGSVGSGGGGGGGAGYGAAAGGSTTYPDPGVTGQPGQPGGSVGGNGGAGGYNVSKGGPWHYAGNGGSGGGFGANGANGGGAQYPGGSGGAAGRAVDRNGYALVFTGGEAADQIKGAYD